MATFTEKFIKNIVKNPHRMGLIWWKIRCAWMMRKYRKMGIKIGKNTTVSPGAIFMDRNMVEIGDDCSVSGTVFVTHDGGARILSKILGRKIEIIKPIKIGNRCVIGASTTIKYGVTIGDDCIVAMGSVVIKDVEAGTVVGGNPAKVIGDTFAYRAKIDAMTRQA